MEHLEARPSLEVQGATSVAVLEELEVVQVAASAVVDQQVALVVALS